MKTKVLQSIGEGELGYPIQVTAGLTANDRLKYYFSLLQVALVHADHPELPTNTLRQERLACGIDDPRLDEIVATARRDGEQYRIPGCARVLAQINSDLRLMAEPLLAAANPPESQSALRARLERALQMLPAPQDGVLDAEAIYRITRVAQGNADSVHKLVMDLHVALNRVRADLAEERLDGAAVYHIADADRPLIRAFMAGLNRTAPLKFGHPGLGTTATRAGGRLVIENDIGETDVHVIVIRVEGTRATVVYTDVHPQRLEFFRHMLAPCHVHWAEDPTVQTPAAAAPFYTATGRFDARNDAELQAYLGFLASRLVFLIDWNRARKQLRTFLRAKHRIELLQWAAAADVGHRGFLQLGGAQLINRAIETTAGSAMHFGDHLCDVLSDDSAMDFMRFVLRAAAEGLRNHQPAALVQDRVRAELHARFSSEETRLLRLAGDHAAMIFEIACLVRDGIRDIGPGADHESYRRLAARARSFEHDADQVLVATRGAVERRPEYKALFRVVEAADDASDELEEVAFLLQLLAQSEPAGEPLHALGTLADLLAEGTQEWVKALSRAALAERHGSGAQEDAGDFLTAINEVFACERRADDADRVVTREAVQHACDFRQLHLYAEIGRSLEAAADALKWAGLIIREYFLGSVLGA